jgi:hypothetical protein
MLPSVNRKILPSKSLLPLLDFTHRLPLFHHLLIYFRLPVHLHKTVKYYTLQLLVTMLLWLQQWLSNRLSLLVILTPNMLLTHLSHLITDITPDYLHKSPVLHLSLDQHITEPNLLLHISVIYILYFYIDDLLPLLTFVQTL